MKILVYGAGAVGGYLGAKLAQQQHDVTFITRTTTASLITQNGLVVTEGDTEITITTTVLDTVAQAFLGNTQPYDLIIMAMKSYDLVAAIDPLVAFCPDPPPIITIQNGIDIEQPLIEQFGAEKIISGAFTMPVRRDTPNHLIVERSDRGFAIAPTQPGTSVAQWLDLFQQANIPIEHLSDYRAMKWSKAFLNIIGNATSAILNRPPGVIYKSEALFDLEVRMLRETLAVMKALAIPVVDLPGAPARNLARGIRHAPRFLLKPILTRLVDTGRGDKMPSFHIDLFSGRHQTEVPYHNGAIAKAGMAAGVPVPVNRTLTTILEGLTDETLDWREFDGKPNQLLQELRRTEQRNA